MGCCGGLPRRALPTGRCGICLLALGAVQMSYLLAPSFLPEQLSTEEAPRTSASTPTPASDRGEVDATPSPGGAAAPGSAEGEDANSSTSSSPPPPSADSPMAMANTVFQGVALLVHCRASVDICQLRAPLFEGYRRFFSTVRMMLPKKKGKAAPEWATDMCATDLGDPWVCIAKVLRSPEAATWTGLLYMHFDAILSPCVMNRTFEVNKLGVFNFKKLWMTSVQFFEGCNCYNETEGRCKPKRWCHWLHWQKDHKVEWSTAMAQVHQAFPEVTFDFNDTDIWKMDDDMFYIPRPAFQQYLILSDIFGARRNLHHEIVISHILKLLERTSSVGLQDMACTGGCCNILVPYFLKRPTFSCGHKMNLSAEWSRDWVRTFQRADC